MKTPEQLAEEYLERDEIACPAIDHAAEHLVKVAFIDGYKAAEEKYKAQIKELETQLENWQHNAVHGDEGL